MPSASSFATRASALRLTSRSTWSESAARYRGRLDAADA